MMAEYLTVVRPVEIFLSKKFHCKGSRDLEEFLWADHRKGRWDGEFISDLLKIATSQSKMHALGFRDYRQVALAFMEQHLKYRMKDLKGVNAYFDLQVGHTSRTAAAEYAVLRDDHANVSKEAMHEYYLISRAWNELLLNCEDKEEWPGGPVVPQGTEMQGPIEMELEVIDKDASHSLLSRGEGSRAGMQVRSVVSHTGIPIVF